MSQQLTTYLKNLENQSESEQRRSVREVLDALPESVRAQFVAPADQPTSNTLWKIVIWTFAFVTVVSVLILGITVFDAPAKDGTSPEIILAVFTSAAGFLAGLFTEKPEG